MKFSIAIVIPTHDRFHTLNILLKQLNEQKNAINDLQIIVVADTNRDNYIQQISEAHSGVHIVRGTGNWWFTRSVNEGIKKAESLGVSHVLILNDDCEIKNDYLNKIKAAGTEFNGSIIGSICFDNQQRDVILFSGVEKIIWRRFKHILYHKKFSRIIPKELSGVHTSKTLFARGMLIPLSLIKHLGYFDEKLIQYYSDYDYCYRAIKKNISVYISWDAVVYENVSLTSGSHSYIKKKIPQFLRFFGDPYSSTYLPNTLRIIKRNVFWAFWPMALCFYFAATIRANFFKY